MRTSRAVSTISYNSDSFLIEKLNQLYEVGDISFYCFIYHLAEEDEHDKDGKPKNHFHLYIQPNGVIDTDILKKAFAEFDPTNDKPLGVIDFHNSKFVDWYLYSLHDGDYLASKGITRKYHYHKEDIFCSDIDYFNELIHTSNFARFKADKVFYDMVEKGYSFSDILRTRLIPPNLVNSYKTIYNALVVPDFTKDNNIVDAYTGEVRRRVF